MIVVDASPAAQRTMPEPDSSRASDFADHGSELHGPDIRPHRVTQRRLSTAGTTALQLGPPLEDCICLARAIEFECDLATCDVRFADQARACPRVRLLADDGPAA